MFTCNCFIIHNLMFLSTYGRHCQRKRDKPDNYISSYFSLFSMTKPIIRGIQIRQDTPDNKKLDQVSSAKCLLSFKRIREA